MRKDLERLGDYYPWPEAHASSGVKRLGWPNARHLATSYATLLSPIDFAHYSPDRRLRLLDLGCGVGFLLDYLQANGLLESVDYTGVDVLNSVLDDARQRWPNARFDRRDVRDEPFDEEAFDYCIACGLFNLKHGNSYPDAVAVAESTMRAVWPSVTIGLGFNSMSKHVDWERDDLFHWPLDEIMAYCKRDLSRHVSFRLDSGLWPVFTLVLKAPRDDTGVLPEGW
jgi:SAM-dependent methyltransferase